MFDWVVSNDTSMLQAFGLDVFIIINYRLQKLKYRLYTLCYILVLLQWRLNELYDPNFGLKIGCYGLY